jgi:paired small multidrug resistance pump
MQSQLLLILGLIGSAIVVIAYLLNQTNRLGSSDWRFPAANLVGAGAILLSLTDAWNLPAATIEFFWAAISLYGLVRSFRQQSV